MVVNASGEGKLTFPSGRPGWLIESNHDYPGFLKDFYRMFSPPKLLWFPTPYDFWKASPLELQRRFQRLVTVETPWLRPQGQSGDRVEPDPWHVDLWPSEAAGALLVGEPWPGRASGVEESIGIMVGIMVNDSLG